MITRDRQASTLRVAVFVLPLLLAACADAPPKPSPAATAVSAAAPIAPALQAAAQALLAGAPPARYAQGLVRADAAGKLQVYVRVAQITPSLQAALQQAGLQQQEAVAAMGVVQGWVAPAALAQLARVPGVLAIEAPRYARPR